MRVPKTTEDWLPIMRGVLLVFVIAMFASFVIKAGAAPLHVDCAETVCKH